MTSPEPAVAQALRAAEVQSPSAFSWFGRTDEISGDAIAAMDSTAIRASLVERLRLRLYSSFYCTGAAVRADDRGWGRPPQGWTTFVQALSDANAGTGSAEPGWRVDRLEDERIAVRQRTGPLFWAHPDEIVAATKIEPGAEVTVLLPRELVGLSPGFYMALGDVGLSGHPGPSIARFYWNVRSDGAVPLVGAVTSSLNHHRIPFRLKVANDPEAPRRCDAAVLYVHWRDRHIVAGVVGRIHPAIGPHLDDGTPAFTKRLVPGVAFAEDPSGADSFGMHRCRLVAEALADGAGNPQRSLEERLAVVKRRFADAGLRLDRPHLAGSRPDDGVMIGSR